MTQCRIGRNQRQSAANRLSSFSVFVLDQRRMVVTMIHTHRISPMNVSNTIDTANVRIRELWMAGLGAVSQIQDQSESTFNSLIQDGKKLQKKTANKIEKQTDSVRKDVGNRYDTIKSSVSKRIDSLGNVFENRVASVLARFDIPTAVDVKQLTLRVEALNKQVKAIKARKS